MMKTFRIIFSALFCLVILLSNVGMVVSTQTTAARCPLPTPQAVSNQPSVDDNQVAATAYASTQYQSVVKSASVVLNGVSYYSNWDKVSCKATPIAVFATFIATFTNGTKNIILVNETVPPTAVTNIEVLPVFYPSLSNKNVNAFLSGYQFCSGATYCSGTLTEIYDGDGYFAQPTIDKPSNHGSNQPGCNWLSDCTLATWIGLSNYPGTPPSGQTTYLLQAGSWDSWQSSSGNGCNCYHYQLWYENLTITSSSSGPPPVLCGTAKNFGDTIDPTVFESSYTGNTGYWYVWAYDATLSKICEPTVSGLSAGEIHWKVVPYYASYLLERPQYATSFGQPLYLDLAYFSTFNFYGELVYSSAYHSITTPYNNNWGTYYNMTNSGVRNICSGSYSGGSCSQSIITSGSYGYFTNTWLTSQNT